MLGLFHNKISKRDDVSGLAYDVSGLAYDVNGLD